MQGGDGQRFCPASRGSVLETAGVFISPLLSLHGCQNNQDDVRTRETNRTAMNSTIKRIREKHKKTTTAKKTTGSAARIHATRVCARDLYRRFKETATKTNSFANRVVVSAARPACGYSKPLLAQD